MLRALANTNVHWEYLRKEPSKNRFSNSFDHKPVSRGHYRTVRAPQSAEGSPGLRRVPSPQEAQRSSVYGEGAVAETISKAELRGKADDAPFDSEPHLREAWLARGHGVGPWGSRAPKQQTIPRLVLKANHSDG